PHAGHLRLVVLSACESASPGSLHNRLGSVAQALHRAGIAAVVGSRYPLRKDGSVLFTEAFYRKLLVEPASVEAAFLEARTYRRDEMDSFDWGSLQLFARPEDGDDTRPIAFRPYRGLFPFHEEHRRYFFGRDTE